MRSKQRGPRIILSALVLASLLGATAHPEAILRSPVSSVRAGATMPLQGEAFLADQKVKLALQGAFNEYDFPEVQAAGDGTFSMQLEIPPAVRPGAYRLVAIADDGDVVASLDVTVEPAASTAVESEGMGHDMANMGGVAMGGTEMAARADELPIERSGSGIEWGIIGLLVGLSAGFGLSLLRSGGRGTTPGESGTVRAASAP